MTKRAGAVPEETRAGLMAAAADEFAEYGFQHSSLRRICSAAGVTTGALYFFFRDKDDIFSSVIASVTVPFMRVIREHYAGEDESAGETTEEAEDRDQAATLKGIRIYLENRKIFGILLSHRDHPAVKDFFREFTDVSVEHYMKVLEGRKGADRTDLEMFVHMQLDLMLSIAERDMPMEEMLRHAETATRMLRGSFSALTE